MSSKKFTVASWNVEHFRGDPSRVVRISGFLKGDGGGPAEVPDVFALYEVEGKDVYALFMDAFQDHLASWRPPEPGRNPPAPLRRRGISAVAPPHAPAGVKPAATMSFGQALAGSTWKIPPRSCAPGLHVGPRMAR